MINTIYDSDNDFRTGYKRPNKRRLLAVAVGIGVVAIIIGVLIGYFSKPDTKCPSGPCLGDSVPSSIISDGDTSIKEKFHNLINTDQIRDYLRQFSSYPHLGGTDGSSRLADEVAQTWRNQGLDSVSMEDYDVLMSYPDVDNPNYIALYNGNSKVFQSADNEVIPGANMTGVIQPYHSYSPSGHFTGNLYYVNYARPEDFDHLIEKGINITGSIVICRYGKIFRGSKVVLAAQYGAVGVAMYTDPADYAAEGTDTEDVYPHTWWLPPTGVQRGTVYAENGDPLTPGFPATSTAYRLNETTAYAMPSIPSHPISYADAYHFLINLEGVDTDASWQGGLNFTYKYGPLKSNMSVELAVFNNNSRRNITNVYGYISGLLEPDRYVLIGNHRDAWAFGAMDPTIGTSVMMEISRSFGRLLSEGWRPRRTIVFCSWGAEEFALIGSYEFVENFNAKLGQRAVAYLNMDTVVQGNYSLVVGGLPLMDGIVFEVTKQIETPNTPGKTLYSEWQSTYPSSDFPDEPEVHGLGAGSDYAGFFIFSGIPCSDFGFLYDPKLDLLDYPVYHSGIETFNYYQSFIDPDFKYAQVMARLVGEVARRLADDYLLPLDVTAYAKKLQTNVLNFKEYYNDLLQNNSISLDNLEKAVQRFELITSEFYGRLNEANRNNPLTMRAYSDQLMLLERYFIDTFGLPDRPLYRHVIYAPSSTDGYAGSTFPGLVDILYNIDQVPDPSDRWQQFQQHLATVVYLIDSAANSLQPFHLLDRSLSSPGF